MDKLSLCRICLVEDVKMYTLMNEKLQELYEILTKMPFVTKDMKPVQVCYICHARLRHCHRLQATCLKSEEFLNKIITDNELKQMELPDLNTFTIVHPLSVVTYVPSTTKDSDDDDDKIDEDNDDTYDQLEIKCEAQIKKEFFEDDSFINQAVDIELEATVKDEDICTEDGGMSDNSHTMQDIKLEHDIQLKPVKIVLERIDFEQFKEGAFTAKSTKYGLPNIDTKRTISTEPKTKVTVSHNKIIEKVIEQAIQTRARPETMKHEDIITKIFLKGKRIEEKGRNIKISSDVTKINQYSCNVCEKKFTLKSSLVKHTRMHTGEKLYRCNLCEKSYIEKASLVSHTYNHTGERPYECDICKKDFTNKSNLVSHLRRHITGKSYKCDICEKFFTSWKGLATHKILHTDGKPYSCVICKRRFNRKSSVITHMYIHRRQK